MGAAVLVRALEPTDGLERMAERRGPVARRHDGAVDPRLLCSGPARLTQALAIGRAQNGLPAWREPLVVLPRPGVAPDDSAPWSGSAPEIVATPRDRRGRRPAAVALRRRAQRVLSRPLRRPDARPRGAPRALPRRA